MNSQLLKTRRSEAGFTLVELAIVMIIIGLLIAGVLKGQELIGNAQVTSTVAQIKALDGAVSTFRDMYDSLPGDIALPGARLPNCNTLGAVCNTAGNGNGSLGVLPSATPAGTESARFFVHLSTADLITGINPALATPGAWGNLYPQAKIPGTGFVASTAAGVAVGEFTNLLGATVPSGGLYLTLTSTANAPPALAIDPNKASRIDIKLDDGVPTSGVVRGGGTAGAGATQCGNAAGNGYNEQAEGANCILYIRIQG